MKDVNSEIVAYLINLFNIKAKPLHEGLKYLGFHLKPVGYTSVDWSWIHERFFKRIAGWEFKCISLARRFILTEAVLVQLMVYWAHLFFIPINIIHNLDRTTSNFIWGGNKDHRRFHLTKLSNLYRPKKLGGWGILDLNLFHIALLCKSLWKVVFGDNIWSKIIKTKYMENRDLTFWYRQGSFGPPHGSAIWRSF